jgi:hypothetical protein
MSKLTFSKLKLDIWTMKDGKFKLVKIPMKYKQNYLDTFSLTTVQSYYIIDQWLKELRNK